MALMTYDSTIASLSIQPFCSKSLTAVSLNLHKKRHAVPCIKPKILLKQNNRFTRNKNKITCKNQFPAEMVTPQTQVTPRHYACVLHTRV